MNFLHIQKQSKTIKVSYKNSVMSGRFCVRRCFYFMMIAPSYDKTDADYDPLEQGIYTELSWISSVEPAAPLATLTDAEETVASTTDAE